MINWIFVKYLRDKNQDVSPIQESAQALLSSTIADGDVVTDWLYYVDIQNNEDVPEWLKILQLISCITGTFSWLSVATDGNFVNLIRLVILRIIYLCVLIVVSPLRFLLEIMDRCYSYSHWIDGTLGWMENNVLDPLMEGRKQKLAFSSGSLLIFGIILEDIPQLVATFLIEDKIKSDHPTGEISSAALVNLNFAIFDIFHKLAQAFDLRSDVLNPAYSVMYKIQAHKDVIWSLVVVGANQILSTSSDKTAKLWNTTTGKCKKVFKRDSDIVDAVVTDNSKVITACYDKCLCVFNINTGDIENKLTLDYRPNFVSLSPSGRSVFSGGEDGHIQRWDDLQSEESSFVYDWRATSLAFLDSNVFVSICEKQNLVRLGNINNEQPMQTIRLERYPLSLLIMSPTVFLIGDTSGSVLQYVYSEDEWKLNSTIEVSNEHIFTLLKVDQTLFVASDKDNAKVYDLKYSPLPLFIFKGYVSLIRSSILLREQKAIATGDDYGNIKIWSIEKYLKNDTQDTSQNSNNNDGHDEDPTIDVANISQSRNNDDTCDENSNIHGAKLN